MDALFTGHPLATHTEIACLLEMSTATLRRLGDQRKIFYRLKGTAWRFYAREDVEQYIGKMAVNLIPISQSTGRVVEFTAERARQKRKRQLVELGLKGKR